MDGCDGRMRARGLCIKHYRRLQKHGDVSRVTNRWDGHIKVSKICEVADCQGASGTGRYCPKHSGRYYRNGDPLRTQVRVAPNRATEDSFWARVHVGAPDACWDWTGSVNEWGYGYLRYQGKQHRAHRVAFLLNNGYLPARGRMVCHHCDNPRCCNPDHLYDGTAADNARDMFERGRATRHAGEAWKRARLK